MGLHTALMMNGMGLKTPTFSQLQKKSVTMTLASRPVQRAHVSSADKKLHPITPVVKKIIREIPAPKPLFSEEKIHQEEDPQTDDIESLTEPTDEHTSPDSNATDGAANFIEATPLYKRNPPPQYPATARRRGYQGTVTLEVLVTESGTVQKIKIFESSGSPVLDNAAITAVTNWFFSPATRMGQPIAMWVMIPVQFILR
jgi:protein TonB